MVLNIRSKRLRTKRAELINVFLCIIRFTVLRSSSVQSTFYCPCSRCYFPFIFLPLLQLTKNAKSTGVLWSEKLRLTAELPKILHNYKITSHYQPSIQWQWADCKQWAINIRHAEIIAHPSGIKLNLWPAINNFRENVRGWFVELGNATEVVIC